MKLKNEQIARLMLDAVLDFEWAEKNGWGEGIQEVWAWWAVGLTQSASEKVMQFKSRDGDRQSASHEVAARFFVPGSYAYSWAVDSFSLRKRRGLALFYQDESWNCWTCFRGAFEGIKPIWVPAVRVRTPISRDSLPGECPVPLPGFENVPFMISFPSGVITPGRIDSALNQVRTKLRGMMKQAAKSDPSLSAHTLQRGKGKKVDRGPAPLDEVLLALLSAGRIGQKEFAGVGGVLEKAEGRLKNVLRGLFPKHELPPAFSRRTKKAAKRMKEAALGMLAN